MTADILCQLKLTAAQARDFARCARVAGVELEDWMIQCAAVQAAHAIDAMQAAERRRRSERLEASASRPINTRRAMDRRARRQRQ